MTFNIDTIWSTLVAGSIVLMLGFCARNQLTKDTDDHVPTKLQLLWETIVGQVNTPGRGQPRQGHPFVAPLAMSLFFFILICNWLELHPQRAQRATPPPAARADRRHQPHLRAGAPVRWSASGPTASAEGREGLLQALPRAVPGAAAAEHPRGAVKPITLALRLFGNIFAGGIMLALIGLIPIVRVCWAAEPHLEAVRHVHRRHPGLHLRPADRALLRHGGCRHDDDARGRARAHDEHDGPAR